MPEAPKEANRTFEEGGAEIKFRTKEGATKPAAPSCCKKDRREERYFILG